MVTLVIRSDKRRPHGQSHASQRRTAGVLAHVDVLPYTEQEVKQRLSAGDPFLRRVLAEAMSLL